MLSRRDVALSPVTSARPSRQRVTLETVREPVPATEFDREYWLAHSEGYQVDDTEGRIGFVEEIRHVVGGTMLAVRASKLGRRILLVPLTEVAFIVPRSQRIWLRAPATIIGSERRESPAH
jgi:hypothetical protein